MDPRQIAAALGPLSPEQRAELLNQSIFGFDATVGLRLRHVAVDRLVADLEVTERHVQPYGLVHGGVYATLAESACSVGGAFSVMAQGLKAVGVENRTRFLRGVRAGVTLRVEATPIAQEGTTLVWGAEIRDADGVCASARVTLRVLEPGRRIAGQPVHFEGGE